MCLCVWLGVILFRPSQGGMPEKVENHCTEPTHTHTHTHTHTYWASKRGQLYLPGTGSTYMSLSITSMFPVNHLYRVQACTVIYPEHTVRVCVRSAKSLSSLLAKQPQIPHNLRFHSSNMRKTTLAACEPHISGCYFPVSDWNGALSRIRPIFPDKTYNTLSMWCTVCIWYVWVSVWKWDREEHWWEEACFQSECECI